MNSKMVVLVLWPSLKIALQQLRFFCAAGEANKPCDFCIDAIAAVVTASLRCELCAAKVMSMLTLEPPKTRKIQGHSRVTKK